MNLLSQLQKYSKKTISREELRQLSGSDTEEMLYRLLTENESILKPIKSSGTNGNRKYPIYQKYHITLPETKTPEIQNKIMTLHPLLLANGWLMTHPQSYIDQTFVLEKINGFLMQREEKREKISKKERSFSLFGEEKYLEKSEILSLLNKLGITKEELLYFETPEYCFNDFIPERRKGMTLLICENKDIWFDLRRLMFEDGKHFFFGAKIDGVIYGAGNKISEKKALSEYTAFLKAEDVTYLYFGDIDREGFDIFLRVKQKNEAIKIDLFLPGYAEMLQKSITCVLPDSEDRREHTTDYGQIFELFSPKQRQLLQTYLKDNKRLPQEILTYEDLKKNSEE